MIGETDGPKSQPVLAAAAAAAPMPLTYPRVAIEFCVQCKWNLRAAYYCQELLQTFSHSLGEVALIPSTAGTFIVSISLPDPTTISTTATAAVAAAAKGQTPDNGQIDTVSEKEASRPLPAPPFPTVDLGNGLKRYVLWDRKADGGFPETKDLKRRVRDLVQPGKGLGHVDRNYRPSGEDKEKEMKGEGEGKGESGGGGGSNTISGSATKEGNPSDGVRSNSLTGRQSDAGGGGGLVRDAGTSDEGAGKAGEDCQHCA